MAGAQPFPILLTGVGVGFLGGLFGKGGRAIATPLLALLGVPGFVAVAAPLPATVPGTFVASVAYWRRRELDWPVVTWSLVWGVPATIVGAWLSRFTGAGPLLIVTAVMVLGFGVSFLLYPESEGVAHSAEGARPRFWTARLAAVTIFVGLVSGLLANSGGFLLAPCYAKFLRLRLKTAFACSLAVSMVLAVPGTVVHWWLGHIDWKVVAILAVGSVPCSYLGAMVALRARTAPLGRLYGLALTALGVFFLWQLR